MKKRKTLGFTLIELMVVITIISILATMGINTFTTAQKKARDSKRQSDVRQIMSAIGTTTDLNGNLRVADTPATATYTFTSSGTTGMSATGNSVFIEALGGKAPIFPKGPTDDGYHVNYNVTSNKACVCAQLEVKKSGNADADSGCSANGAAAVSPFEYVNPSSGACTDCDYFCLAI